MTVWSSRQCSPTSYNAAILVTYARVRSAPPRESIISLAASIPTLNRELQAAVPTTSRYWRLPRVTRQITFAVAWRSWSVPMARCPAMSLSLEYLRCLGMRPAVVERSVPSKPFPTKQDLFGVFDIVFIDKERRQIGFVQTTSWTNRHGRIQKMEAAADVIFELHAIPSAVTELHAWKKVANAWEVSVWRTHVTYGPDQKDHVELERVFALSMKQARAKARKEKQAQGSSQVHLFS